MLTEPIIYKISFRWLLPPKDENNQKNRPENQVLHNLKISWGGWPVRTNGKKAGVMWHLPLVFTALER